MFVGDNPLVVQIFAFLGVFDTNQQFAGRTTFLDVMLFGYEVRRVVFTKLLHHDPINSIVCRPFALPAKGHHNSAVAASRQHTDIGTFIGFFQVGPYKPVASASAKSVTENVGPIIANRLRHCREVDICFSINDREAGHDRIRLCLYNIL